MLPVVAVVLLVVPVPVPVVVSGNSLLMAAILGRRTPRASSYSYSWNYCYYYYCLNFKLWDVYDWYRRKPTNNNSATTTNNRVSDRVITSVL